MDRIGLRASINLVIILVIGLLIGPVMGPVMGPVIGPVIGPVSESMVTGAAYAQGQQSPTQKSALLKTFSWAGGIEDTFIPQERPGLRPLEEYELTQHYAQWREDIDRAASLGITKLRWGTPWYKSEPQPGVYDWKWTDEVLDYMINKRHIDPIIDLVHYGTPLWMKDSFTDPAYAQAVSDYARAFATRYKNKVKYYTPLNEPAVNSEFCGLNGQWPPYLKGDVGYLQVLLPIARGIQMETRAIRDADPDATIVAVEAMTLKQATSAETQNDARNAFDRDMLPWDLVNGKVDERHPLYGWLLKNGVKVEKLDELRKGAIHADVLGVNFYPWSIKALSTANGKVEEKPGPQRGRLLLEVLKNVWEHAKTPMFVTETSSLGDVTTRALWMAETIDAVRLARDEGIPVVGYTWFPIITMVDWTYRTSTQPAAEHLIHLGLWDSKFDAAGILQRQETPLVDNYRSWVKLGMPVQKSSTVQLGLQSAP